MEHATRARRARSLVINLSISAASLIVCLLLAEVAVRWLKLDDQLEYEVDESLYWRLQPNQDGTMLMANGTRSPLAHINGLGLRGVDVQLEPHGKFRILMLGDSFTFGSGVGDDETFSAILQASLGQSAEVINAGVPGYGIFQAERSLRELGPSLNPDLIMVTVPTGDIGRVPFRTREEERVFVDTERARKQMRRISALAAFLYRRFDHLRLRLSGPQAPPVPNAVNPGDDARFHDLWRSDLQRLAAMGDEAHRIGARLVLVAWPHNKDPARDQAILSGMRDLVGTGSIVTAVDLGPVLSAHPMDELVIAGDGHPSRVAHRVVGLHLGSVVSGLGQKESAGGR